MLNVLIAYLRQLRRLTKLNVCVPLISTGEIFNKAADLAIRYNDVSAVLTGKGEPTLYPEQITDYCYSLRSRGFPIIDLQTNGTLFLGPLYQNEEHLAQWFGTGE